MKDELPDLTPYLNKKGGNSQGRTEENAPAKADISSKLSALVKKPGTNTGSQPSVPASMVPGYIQDQAAAAAALQESNVQAPVESESPIGIVRAPAAPAAPVVDSYDQSYVQADNYSAPNSNGGAKPASDNGNGAAHDAWSVLSEPSYAPAAAAPQAVPPSAYDSGVSSPSREINRPGQVVPPSPDKLRGPQAKPMSTLSSNSAPPLLKTPAKQPGRPAQPYNYKPVIEPGREAMAPKAPISPTSKAPQPMSSRPSIPSSAPSASPLATPAQPQYQSQTQPQSQSSINAGGASNSGVSANTFGSTSGSYSGASSSSMGSGLIRQPAPKPAAPPRQESDAEKLARAFKEEAQALQESAANSASGFASSNAPIQYENAMDEPLDESILNNSFFEDDGPVNAQNYQSEFQRQELQEEYRPSYLDEPEEPAALEPPLSPLRSALAAFAPQASNAPAEIKDVPPPVEAVVEQSYAASLTPASPAAPAPSYEPSQLSAPVRDDSRAAAHDGPKSSLSNLFDSGLLNTRYQEEPPKKSLGFGSLLGSVAPTDEEGAHHTTIADLMVPTGEHDALLAPDRREDTGHSAFDEISAQLDADQASVEQSLSGNSFEAPPTDFGAGMPGNFGGESVRVDENSSAPTFGSLFGSDIVTSGQDFDNKWAPPSDGAPEPMQATADGNFDSDLLEAPYEEPSYEESPPPTQKSLAISKLLEAVNQGDVAPEPYNWAPQPAPAAPESSEAAAQAALDALRAVESEPAVQSLADLYPEASPIPEPSPVKEAVGIATPDPENMSAKALEALAGFVPQVGEEQHETKGLLAKLKAKDAAEKAAKKAAKAKAEADSKAAADEAAEAKIAAAAAYQIESPPEVEITKAEPSSKSSSLASLLSGEPGQELSVQEKKVSLGASLMKAAPVVEPEPDEDDSSSNSLGDAISSALDKLLADAGESSAVASEVVSPVAPPEIKAETKSADNSSFASATTGFNKLLEDDPDRFNRPINSHLKEAEQVLEEAVAASAVEPPVVAAPVENHPMTLTNSKVDALSRLLEVASKAPNKAPDDKNKPNESANQLSQMINKPAGKVSRQNETIDPNFANKESFTSPFGGGTSPFGNPGASYSGPGQNTPPSSPFGTPVNSTNSSVSLNHTPAGGFSPTGQSAPSQANYTGTGSMSDMPKASGIASDAVSARIAALNRKLEEQGRTPGNSATVKAMPNPGQSLAPPPLDLPPPPVIAPPPADFAPNPIVDGSPQTRAELVNRILGSANIPQTAMPDQSNRANPDPSNDPNYGHTPPGKGQKPQKNPPPKSKARARGGQKGFDPRPIVLIVVVLLVLGGGGYFAVQHGVINLKALEFKGFDMGKAKPAETKMTIDQVIKSGDTAKAIDMLESKKESGKFSAAEGDKLNTLYYQTAEKAYSNNDDPAEAMKLLEKIQPKTKKYKESQKLLKKFKKKVKKN